MRDEDEMNDDGESEGKGRRYPGVFLLGLLVFLALFWHFRIWKTPETEVAPPPAAEGMPGTVPLESEVVDGIPPFDPTALVFESGTAPIATVPSQGAPAPSTPIALGTPAAATRPPDQVTFPKALKEGTAVPLTPRKSVSAKKPEKPAVQRASTRGDYTIQVGSFTDESSSAAFTKRLKGKGYDAYVIKSAVPGVGIRWRVRVGHFANRAEAQSLAQRFQKKEGLPFFLAKEGA